MDMTKQQGELFMDTDYSKEEWNAIYEKMEHPERVVYCPRCGKELTYHGVGNSCEVICPTEGCIWERVRGL